MPYIFIISYSNLAKNVTGPYKDVAGNYATYTSAMGSNNTSGSVGERLLSYTKWSCQPQAHVAQGHNSVLTDSNGKKFLVYHTRFNDGAEYHELRVHQLFTNKDGWLVTAPFEYTGESLKSTGYTTGAVVDTYEFMENYLNASALNKIATSKTIMGANYGYNQTEAQKTVNSGSSSSSSTVTKSTNKVYSDGWYYIKNVNSQKYLEAASNTGSNGTSCLDVAGGKSADGTNICEYKVKGSVNQLWVFESTSAPR